MKRIRYLFILLTGLVMTSSSLAIVQTAPPTSTSSASTVNASSAPPHQTSRLWNLQDADILSIINEVSAETGKNFVVDPRVTGKISLISSKPIKPTEVYQLFLSVLELLGYSAIPSGNVVKIVPNMESAEFATRVATEKIPGKGEEVVVRVIPLENITANQLIPVIRPLLPQWSNVSAYSPGNVLILVGRAANLQRIVNIIHDVDKSSDNNIDIVPLRQASAAQLANVLTNLQNTARNSGEMPQVSVTADERSNSILISGNKKARLHMRVLISQLDTPSSGSSGSTEVVYLRYLQAKTLAPLLGKIAQNMSGKGSEDKDKEASKNTSSNSSYSNYSSSNSSTTNKTKTPENVTNIQAELSTNALIITAPPTLMRALNSVIAKLDIRPAQVLVEGIIVEVNQDNLRNLGIQWGALSSSSSSNSSSTSLAPTTPSTTYDFPPFGAGNVGIIPHMEIQAVLNMLENRNGVDILSTPSVVVLDNHKASLTVGQDVPEQNGSYATTGNTSTVTPYNTVSRKTVALVLKVTPQINLGSAVRLAIDLKNDTLQNPDNPGLNPIINTSNIVNSVIINSQDIVVLGGLISNNITETINRVPLLSDIPVVGRLLFTQKIRKLEKKNLLVFIKPTILHSAEDATTITNTKYNTIRNTQIQWPVNLSEQGEQKLQNILPPWKNNVELPKPFEAP